MFFRFVFEKGLAQNSYMIGCQESRTAIVIDPKRDIDTYLEIAEKEGFRITHIAETHIHADFLSGSRELAAQTGAEILLSDEGGNEWQYTYSHTGLKDGQIFMVGNLKFEVMHTPGHTPEHISFLLTDTKASDKPLMIFTGDFVFVGDVGRPDLLEKAAGYIGTMEKGARDMFRSLKKFSGLPDYLQLWPAHGAGSACGKSLGAVPSSTVGYEKMVNWALQIDDEEKFVTALLEGQPEPPKYFAMMKKLNKTGPAILGPVPQPARLSYKQFDEAVMKGILLIDTRDKLSYAGGHIRGSINIQDNSSFSTWAGWILDYQKPFMLIASEERIQELNKALIRIGLDNITGYITDIDKWANAGGHECEVLRQTTVEELRDSAKDEAVYILDVRNEKEFLYGHIPEAHHLFVGYLEDKISTVPKDRKIVVHCASGDRSSIAASILLKNGFSNVYNLTGGINTWLQAGLPVEKPELEAIDKAQI